MCSLGPGDEASPVSNHKLDGGKCHAHVRKDTGSPRVFAFWCRGDMHLGRDCTKDLVTIERLLGCAESAALILNKPTK